MSIKPSLFDEPAVQDFLDMSNIEASSASNGDYIPVDANAEWNEFLTLIK